MRSWRTTLALAALAATTLLAGAPLATASARPAPGALTEAVPALEPGASAAEPLPGEPDPEPTEPASEPPGSAKSATADGPTGDDEGQDDPPNRAGHATIPGRYIVRFVEGTAPEVAARELRGDGVEVGRTFRHVFPGAVIRVPDRGLAAVQRNPRVAEIEPDRQVSRASTQGNPPWGLDRTDQRTRPLSGSFASPSDGAGVTVYVVDTGIRSSHSDFGGRVLPGETFVADGRGTGDCDGHGTHVAGTVGGTTHGVAKAVSLIPVRVLDCDGWGSASNVIGALDWIRGHHADGIPAVANLSLGTSFHPLVNLAAQQVVADGVVVVAAAGNEWSDACGYSPGSATGALTVAATDRYDFRPWWSNFGSCVDLFAPGVDITSTGHGSNAASVSMSGTSMAAPHAAGVAAVHLALEPTLTPSQVVQRMLDHSTFDLVRESGAASPNRLLYLPPDGVPRPQPSPPSNDAFATAAPMPLDGNVRTATNVLATTEPGEPAHAGVPGGSSVWWTFTPAASGKLVISTEGSTFDTVLAVYTGDSVGSLTHRASNDDVGTELNSRVQLSVSAGTTYRVAVDGYFGVQGTVRLRHAFVPPQYDHLASARSFNVTSTGVLHGSTFGATRQSGEPEHVPGSAAARSTWWTFTPSAYGTVTLSTKGSTFDTVLGVYTGSTMSGLTRVVSNDNQGAEWWSQVRFRVAPGVAYRVAVDGYLGSYGWVALNRSFTAATKPAAPAAPTTTSANAAAKLSWAKPADGGAAITGYQARCVPRDTSLRTRSVTTTSRSATVSSLVNGKTYDCKVRAQNGVGYSAWSATRSVKPLGPPSAPTNLTHRPGDRQVALSWGTPTSSGGTTVLDYQVRCSTSTWTKTATTTSRSFTMTGLANGVDHQCSVRARNAVGYGPTATTRHFQPRR